MDGYNSSPLCSTGHRSFRAAAKKAMHRETLSFAPFQAPETRGEHVMQWNMKTTLCYGNYVMLWKLLVYYTTSEPIQFVLGVQPEREMATKYIQALYETGPEYKDDMVAVPIDMYAFISAAPVLRHIIRESGAVVLVTIDGVAHVSQYHLVYNRNRMASRLNASSVHAQNVLFPMRRKSKA